MTSTTKIGTIKAATHIQTWIAAARHEALLNRHMRIEETDLLLGLLAQGGPAAELLGRHGVTLARARRGVTELDDIELARAGLAGAASLRPDRPSTNMQALSSHADLDMTSAAESICFERKGRVRTDGQALAAMLADPGSPASQILEHLEVDLPALRGHLRNGAGEPLKGAVAVPVPAVYRKEGMTFAFSCTHFISAPVDQVRTVLSDPERLADWMLDPGFAVERVTPAQVVGRWERAGFPRRACFRLAAGACGEIVWRMQALTGRHAGAVGQVREYRLEETPGGTLVHHTLAARSFGVLGRIISPVVRLLIRIGLRHHCRPIASVCADVVA